MCIMDNGNKVYAPMIIITCNRYENFRACLESLQRNTIAAETEIFIGIDYPPSSKYEEGYYKIVDYLSKGIVGFKKVNILKREHNFGVSGNWNDLADRACEKYDRYIGTEDDNVFAVDFLESMNYYLNLYKSDIDIFAICAHTLPREEEFFRGKDIQTFVRYGYNGWGVALWRDKWWEFMGTISEEWIEKMVRKTSYRKALKMPKRIRRNLVSRFLRDDWTMSDTIITFYLWFSKKYQLCLSTTKAKNNGWDGLGVNAPKALERNEGIFDDDTVNFAPENIRDSIYEVQKDYYSLFYGCDFKIKREIIYLIMHLFGFKKAKRILNILKLDSSIV